VAISTPEPGRVAVGGEPDEVTKKLEGHMGVFDIVFTVLAFNAPMSVFVGFITVIIGYGNGLGAPMTFIAAGALMLIFAGGFTAMSRYLPNPGAFYAYISAGLGRPAGLGAAFVAIVSYFFILIGGYAFGGLSFQALVHDTLGGPDIPWWGYTMVVMGIVAVLGYFSINLSAKILTVCMICEAIMMVVYDTVVFFRGGHDGVHLDSFTPDAAFSGELGLAVIFGIVCFSGFEATAVFREEARDPEKTIPRATYTAILFLLALYALTAWAMINGIGQDEVVGLSAADPTGTALETARVYLHTVGVDIITVLLCTSIFAANLATHNVTTRYIYSLSVDRIFPKVFASVHHFHVSPYRAATLVSVISYAALAACIVFKGEAGKLYATLVGIGGYSLILLLMLTSMAVVLYFRRHPEHPVNVWRSAVAPTVATLLLAGAFWIATMNVDVMIGGSQALANVLIGLFIALLIAGILVALVLERTKPDVYQRIGRQEL
jgi:amino acid transporter